MAGLFEDFSLGPAPNQLGAATNEDGLESFEKGYKAGWDDASKAHDETQTHTSAVLSRNIEAMEFTLVEARAMVLASLAPVLQEIADTLLPQLTAQALNAQLLAELEPFLADAAPDRIRLDISPTDEKAIAALLEDSDMANVVTLNPRETLGEGQIYLSCEDVSKRIDIPQAIEKISTALLAFDPNAQHTELEQSHVG